MKMILISWITFTLLNCRNISIQSENYKCNKDIIEQKYIINGAWKYGIYEPQFQMYLDSAIYYCPTLASAYQQKAMAFFKCKNYTKGEYYINIACELSGEYFDYRAFMVCIFSRDYETASNLFISLINERGDNHIMDHKYSFYLGLCYIQLLQLDKAKTIFIKLTENTTPHYLDYFYLGVIYYNLFEFDKAKICFQKSIVEYSQFSDAYFYLAKIDENNLEFEGRKTKLKLSKELLLNRYTINEDNAKYEFYPYQVNIDMINWELDR